MGATFSWTNIWDRVPRPGQLATTNGNDNGQPIRRRRICDFSQKYPTPKFYGNDNGERRKPSFRLRTVISGQLSVITGH